METQVSGIQVPNRQVLPQCSPKHGEGSQSPGSENSKIVHQNYFVSANDDNFSSSLVESPDTLFIAVFYNKDH